MTRTITPITRKTTSARDVLIEMAALWMDRASFKRQYPDQVPFDEDGSSLIASVFVSTAVDMLA